MKFYCQLGQFPLGLGWLSQPFWKTGGDKECETARELKGLCNILGDLGCELGPIVRLEGGRHSRPWEDFSKNKLSHNRALFVSSRESFNLSRKSIYKD